jgi:hypothetical protein
MIDQVIAFAQRKRTRGEARLAAAQTALRSSEV